MKITPKLVASSNAFALCCNGAVITWGDPAEGGDSSEVADQLKQVQDICATRVAFAALIGAADSPGRVVTWGDHLAGGDSHLQCDDLSISQKMIQLTIWHHNFILICCSIF